MSKTRVSDVILTLGCAFFSLMLLLSACSKKTSGQVNTAVIFCHTTNVFLSKSNYV